MKVPILVPTLVTSLLLVSCGNTKTEVHSHAHHEDHSIKSNVWPPELTNTVNETTFPAGIRSRARDSVAMAARESVLNNPQVRAALGTDYQEYDASLGDNKSEDTASFLFFNYASNMTVQAVLHKDGSISVITTDATDFQPAENEIEVNRAIELGRIALESDGHNLADLTGTAMLTHPTDTDSSGDRYFAERLMYVTFGPGNGELPVYSALVNLGTSSVSDSGLLK